MFQVTISRRSSPWRSWRMSRKRSSRRASYSTSLSSSDSFAGASIRSCASIDAIFSNFPAIPHDPQKPPLARFDARTQHTNFTKTQIWKENKNSEAELRFKILLFFLIIFFLQGWFDFLLNEEITGDGSRDRQIGVDDGCNVTGWKSDRGVWEGENRAREQCSD